MVNLLGPAGKKTEPPAEEPEEIGWLDVTEAIEETLNPPCSCSLDEILRRSSGLRDGKCSICGGS